MFLLLFLEIVIALFYFHEKMAPKIYKTCF